MEENCSKVEVSEHPKVKKKEPKAFIFAELSVINWLKIFFLDECNGVSLKNYKCKESKDTL